MATKPVKFKHDERVTQLEAQVKNMGEFMTNTFLPMIATLSARLEQLEAGEQKSEPLIITSGRMN